VSDAYLERDAKGTPPAAGLRSKPRGETCQQSTTFWR